MTKFNSNFLHALPFSDLTVQFALAANTELTYTVPGDNSIAYRCEFAFPYNANVWVGYNITATSPTAGTLTEANRVELRPGAYNGARYVRGGDVLHFVSNATVTDAGFSLLQLPS